MKRHMPILIAMIAIFLCALPSHAQQGPPSVTMLWGAISVPTPAAVTYKVQRADSQTGPFTQVGTPVSALTFIDTTVIRGNTYFWRVLSSCPATGAGCGTTVAPINGDSIPSNVITATIPSATTLPPTPTLTLQGVQ